MILKTSVCRNTNQNDERKNTGVPDHVSALIHDDEIPSTPGTYPVLDKCRLDLPYLLKITLN